VSLIEQSISVSKGAGPKLLDFAEANESNTEISRKYEPEALSRNYWKTRFQIPALAGSE